MRCGPTGPHRYGLALARYFLLQELVEDGVARAGTVQSSSLRALTSTISSTDAQVMLFIAFAPFLLVAALAFFALRVTFVDSKEMSGAKRWIVNITILFLAALTITMTTCATVAFFRSEYSGRFVAISRFDGDGGWRELSPLVPIPVVKLQALTNGSMVVGDPGSTNAVIARTTVPQIRVMNVVLNDLSVPSTSRFGLWIAPSQEVGMSGSSLTGQAMGAILANVSRISTDGTVADADVGTTPTVLGWVTWTYGVLTTIPSNNKLVPLPCGTDPNQPRTDGTSTAVCGVSAWVASVSSALGDADAQQSSFANLLGAVDAARQNLINGPLGLRSPSESNVAKNTIVVQVPNLRNVLNEHRANVAFAVDVYLAYAIMWMIPSVPATMFGMVVTLAVGWKTVKEVLERD
jgi:hypothetical protein